VTADKLSTDLANISFHTA